MTEILHSHTLEEAYRALLPHSRDGRAITVADAVFCDEIGSFLPQHDFIAIPGGEECKDLEMAAAIWRRLSESGVTRHSLLVAIGGGSITDMAGFAASCFKRGIDTAYIPTTVLGAVDAAIGGKTAINFCGLKNEIGTFHQPVAVAMVPELWSRLDYPQLASGFGEVLKTAFLQGETYARQALRTAEKLADGCGEIFSGEQIAACACFKQKIVAEDPCDNGVRRQLNLGHTFAHALESYARKRNLTLSHGNAVALGMVAMSVLSNRLMNFAEHWIYGIANAVKEVFPPFRWRCADFEELYGYMLHDKKNRCSTEVSFVLLDAPGHPCCDCRVEKQQIRAALEITKDCLG